MPPPFFCAAFAFTRAPGLVLNRSMRPVCSVLLLPALVAAMAVVVRHVHQSHEHRHSTGPPERLLARVVVVGQ